jgi:hypothetical protein
MLAMVVIESAVGSYLNELVVGTKIATESNIAPPPV